MEDKEIKRKVDEYIEENAIITKAVKESRKRKIENIVITALIITNLLLQIAILIKRL